MDNNLNIGFFTYLFCINGGSWNNEQQNLLFYFLCQQKANESSNNSLNKTINNKQAFVLTESLPLQYEEEITSEIHENINLPVFLDSAFPKSRRIILYADSGSLKSLLSIAIGKSKYFNKCLYILVDNVSEDDLQRYKDGVGDKSIFITCDRLENEVNNMVNTQNNYASFLCCKIFNLDNKLYKDFKHMAEVVSHVNKNTGIKNKNNNSMDELSAIESIVLKAIDEEIDFICIDSLNGLFGDSRKINRFNLRRIIKIAADNKLTLLCIHHANKEGKMAGINAIKEEFDYVYYLEKDMENNNLPDNEYYINLIEEKSRFSKEKYFSLKATFLNDNIPEFTLLDKTSNIPHKSGNKKQKNLYKTITDILNTVNKKQISFAEMKKLINRKPLPTDGAIKNSLKELSNNGKVRKTNNTWKVITIN